MQALIRMLDLLVCWYIQMPARLGRGGPAPRGWLSTVRLRALVLGTAIFGLALTHGAAAQAQPTREYMLYLPTLTDTVAVHGPAAIILPVAQSPLPLVPYYATRYSAYTFVPFGWDHKLAPGVDAASASYFAAPPVLATTLLHDGPALSPSVPAPTALPRVSYPAVDLYTPSPLPLYGYAMYYNVGVMQEVLANRINMGHVVACPECIGYVALLRAGDLNRKVWLQWNDGVIEGPFLVVDAAAPQHVAHLLARNWVVDVDDRTAQRRGVFGPTWAAVLADPA